MSELLTSLPGDIPGLLDANMPTNRGTIIAMGETRALTARPEQTSDADLPCVLPRGHWELFADLKLDLKSRLSRVQVSWWCQKTAKDLYVPTTPVFSGVESAILVAAMFGADMTPTQIDTLARLVLRLAGR